METESKKYHCQILGNEAVMASLDERTKHIRIEQKYCGNTTVMYVDLIKADAIAFANEILEMCKEVTNES